MTGTTIKICVTVLVIVCYLLYYKLSSIKSKSKGRKIIEKCKNDLNYAREFAESLKFLYYKKELKENQFIGGIKTICDGLKLDESIIIYFKEVKPDTYFILSTTDDFDLNISKNRTESIVKNIKLLCVRLFIDRENNRLKLYSYTYLTRDEESLINVFSTKLFKYLLN